MFVLWVEYLIQRIKWIILGFLVCLNTCYTILNVLKFVLNETQCFKYQKLNVTFTCEHFPNNVYILNLH